jgi:hypothetical protein
MFDLLDDPQWKEVSDLLMQAEIGEKSYLSPIPLYCRGYFTLTEFWERSVPANAEISQTLLLLLEVRCFAVRFLAINSGFANILCHITELAFPNAGNATGWFFTAHTFD